jgi:hypothetical protein
MVIGFRWLHWKIQLLVERKGKYNWSSVRVPLTAPGCCVAHPPYDANISAWGSDRTCRWNQTFGRRIVGGDSQNSERLGARRAQATEFGGEKVILIRLWWLKRGNISDKEERERKCKRKKKQNKQERNYLRKRERESNQVSFFGGIEFYGSFWRIQTSFVMECQGAGKIILKRILGKYHMVGMVDMYSKQHFDGATSRKAIIPNRAKMIRGYH